MRIKEFAKTLLKRAVYPPGSVARVLWGPLRGSRFIIRETPNWASIVGGWETEATRIFKALIRENQVVFDCGANVGMHSLLFAKIVGPRGRVYAFEPLPAAARDITLNADLNFVKNIDVLECALAERRGKASFTVSQNTTQGSLGGLSGGTSEISVSVTTLDDILADGILSPDFIKMDIEGAEGEALAAFKKVVTTYPTFAVDLHAPEQDHLVGAFFARHEYEVYRVGNETAKRQAGQTALLKRIERLDKVWPDPDGIWGTVVAFHPSRRPKSLPE